MIMSTRFYLVRVGGFLHVALLYMYAYKSYLDFGNGYINWFVYRKTLGSAPGVRRGVRPRISRPLLRVASAAVSSSAPTTNTHP